ncbi:TPA: 50S ribosomal protein L30 [Candidatus Woesearchaeota archaeon]|nr:uL30 family ribosomal protein [Candidatus Woesearchaeota archaeon]HIH39188.1 50S ribosomal protein L30 [Candidatus Woesearchaeota archaeon]
MAKIAVILVRGLIGANRNIKDTLKMLNIHRRNVCAILEANKNMLGMVNKVRNYATFGEINEETLKLLKQKKGDSKYYNLNSPRKGYGRKGIKYDFVNGGALGYRGDKINDLIKRML